MPAGDLVTADYQLELRSLLTGAGTSYPLGEEGVGGLGEPEAKSHDTMLGHAPGSYLGRDYAGVRIITVPYLVKGTTPANTGTLFGNLRTAWATSETNLPLHLGLPGFGKLSVQGRPRGLFCDMSQQKHSLIRAMATFVCGDPTLTSLPAAPTIGTATAGVGQATATWTAPSGTVTGYVVTTYRASDNVVLFTDSVGAVLTFTRTGLTAGVGVYFRVAATNATGTGPQSAASNTVTPT